MACRPIICSCSKISIINAQNFMNHQFLFVFFKSWDAYFRNNSYASPPTLAPPPKHHVPISQFTGAGTALAPTGYAGPPMAGYQVDDKLVDDHLAVQAIIRSYQVKSHESEWNEWMVYLYYKLKQIF